jgi:hypothetical protein
MVKVTMLLTDGDAENAKFIREATSARSNAQALSVSLTLTGFLIKQLQNNSDLVLRNERGEFVRVVMPELENIRRDKRNSF